jgi:hypothetical protein
MAEHRPARPNPRVQRARVARCARPGSPLTRHPLGGTKAAVARRESAPGGALSSYCEELAVITLGVAHA